jgi:hypothetical protein
MKNLLPCQMDYSLVMNGGFMFLDQLPGAASRNQLPTSAHFLELSLTALHMGSSICFVSLRHNRTPIYVVGSFKAVLSFTILPHASGGRVS